jgi:hypothetical protein
MHIQKTVSLFALATSLFAASAWAAMPTNPVSDADFMRLPSGKLLTDIRVKGSRLSLSRGSGRSFGSSQQQAYAALKAATQREPDHKVQWVFMDLDAHRVIEKSLSSSRKVFGASSSKVYVASALVDRKEGSLSSSQMQLLANMLVVSSNTAWTNLQSQIGDGSSNKGRERIQAFTLKMGYLKTRGFQGYWGHMHGNELIADEAVETLHDIYKGNFTGAEIVWKLMHTCRTGSSRGRKYIPSSVYVGGKTGTFDGSTVNPETGSTHNSDGSTYRVKIRNHLLVFNVDGHQYGLAILSNSGSDESAALLAGGLLREHTSAH